MRIGSPGVSTASPGGAAFLKKICINGLVELMTDRDEW